MWELDHKESWVPKDWCFWTVMLEKTLESPLDSKEIQEEFVTYTAPIGLTSRSEVFAGIFDVPDSGLTLPGYIYPHIKSSCGECWSPFLSPNALIAVLQIWVFIFMHLLWKLSILCFECESFKFIMDKSREGGTLKNLELYSGEGLFMGWDTFPVAQTVKNLPAMQETRVPSLGWDDPLEKEMATHSSILAWRIPRTEEPGGLQSTGSQRVRHDWATQQQQRQNMHLTGKKD